MRQFILLSLVLAGLFACKKKEVGNCPVTCSKTEGRVYFLGYTGSEIDTIYVRTYKKNGRFDSMLTEKMICDTTQFDVHNAANYTSHVQLSPYYDHTISFDTVVYHIIVNNVTTVDTFPCDHVRSCFTPFAGADISGGRGYCTSLSPGNGLIVLQK